MTRLLSVDRLSVKYKNAPAPCVDALSLDVREGQTLGLVGESGCGKTTLARAIAGLLPPGGAVEGGSISFGGRDLLEMDDRSRRAVQGCGIGMITQESLSSLNPVSRVGAAFVKLLGEKLGMCKANAISRAAGLLEKINCPADVLGRYPFQLSGGQRQRVMIAMAFALRPKLLIADEPTTALDVVSQAHVLEEIAKLRDEHGTAVVLISHNLAVVSRVCGDIAVMYKGRLVEYGKTHTVLHHPSHSYTEGLLSAVPHLKADRSRRLQSIPSPGEAASGGCCFAPCCGKHDSKCKSERPALQPNEKGVLSACWK